MVFKSAGVETELQGASELLLSQLIAYRPGNRQIMQNKDPLNGKKKGGFGEDRVVKITVVTLWQLSFAHRNSDRVSDPRSRARNGPALVFNFLHLVVTWSSSAFPADPG